MVPQRGTTWGAEANLKLPDLLPQPPSLSTPPPPPPLPPSQSDFLTGSHSELKCVFSLLNHYKATQAPQNSRQDGHGPSKPNLFSSLHKDS